MRRNIKSDKKAAFMEFHAGSLILVLAVVLFGIYAIWAFLINGNNPDSMQSCGALTGSNGVCKVSCDVNTEFEFENVGCKGEANKCCVLKDDDFRDIILPEVYGGSSDYNFMISSIRFGTDYASKMPGCTLESTTSTDSVTLLCPPLRSYRIPIVIDVTNTGRETQDVKVSPVPVVVMKGNSDTVRPPGTYTGKEETLGTQVSLTVDVTISSSDAEEGNYLTIYPYAKCETRKCKLTDEKRRGIMSYDPNKFVIVKFVNTGT